MHYSDKPMRRSNLISPWGVGAIVPFPDDESLMIAGLDMWYFGNDSSEFIIKEERLTKRLQIKELRLPPDFRDSKSDRLYANITIPAVRFPTWHYCPFCGTMTKSKYSASRDKCDGYEWKNGRSCSKNQFKRKLIPERFIVVCPEGHIDDFPIMEWVHNNPNHKHEIKYDCRIRRSTGGTSASLAGVFYECSCGAKRNMAGAMNDDSLKRNGYQCRGSKPWLGIEGDIENPCGNPDVKVVQRGGTNVWFADVVSSIYIPNDAPETDRSIAMVLENDYEQILNRRVNGQIDIEFIKMIADYRRVDFDKLKKAILNRMDNSEMSTDKADMTEDVYRKAEYNILVKDSGSDTLDFHCKNYNISNYEPVIHKYFDSISLIPKLKETRAFVGFSRLQPDEGKNLRDKKNMLRLGQDNWLPAIEVFGEGIFFKFNQVEINKWKQNPAVIDRVSKISSSYNQMVERRNGEKGQLNPEYILIHTFAHLLINQLSYECGYGSSSIRERIYCSKIDPENNMYGVLLYTASGDSDGSLGGLVRQGYNGRLENTIISAIENAKWCSSDPICIESSGQGPDSCNLAACHNCALLPETCCENGNKLLDRGVLIGTLTNSRLGFFSDLLKDSKKINLKDDIME